MTHIIPDPSTESGDLSSLQIQDFWDRHGKSVIVGGLFALIAGLVVLIFVIFQHNRELDAQAAFAGAKDDAQFRGIIEKYSGTAPAADASLLLAGSLRKAGKYDDATAALNDVIKKFPDSSYAALASLGLAANQAAAQHDQKYIEALQQTAAKYNNFFVAPYALLSQAELNVAAGKNGDAAGILRNLTAQYPDSISSRIGSQYLERLDGVVDTDSKN